ncbi:hypothetical protein COT30_01975 [Candidatus Micrarchaeota archaeon CG08_land_8_20_14_0_20_49_17]|nr:MAG: hypothetical protein AUJ13_00800 [Candidatus Micrarchaeota archaeon CG1_02_49_24]PIU09918.1 MAG: hypothetical protein COT30_01975 [Candidatus Micrarchaeota archaeon CG08_land_8_20_14_0_20_49_17]HII54255.1 hypothetical protein [Candidatus Micrarchaeota archaeon]
MEPSNTTVCIICRKEVSGTLVKDDVVIETIRKIKKKLGMAKNNKLVVCQGCLEEWSSKRKKYEKTLTQNIVIGIGIVVLLIGLPLILAGKLMLEQVIPGSGLGLIIILSTVMWHVPDIEQRPGEKTVTKPKKIKT